MERYSLLRVSGPADEWIGRAQAKVHLKVDADITADDALIDALIAAVREMAEDFTRRCFVWSAWELRLDAFPSSGEQQILLPRPPCIRLNSLHYVDSDGVERELGSGAWQLDDKSAPARLRPAVDQAWPATRWQMNAVRASYIAGYPINDAGSPTDYAANVPKVAHQAMLLTLGEFYRNRDAAAKLPPAAEALLWPLRVLDFNLSA